MQKEVSRMGKIRKKWSDAELEKALVDIRSGKSTRSISKLSGIPKSTLISKLKGHRPIGKKTGPPTVLSAEEEAIIVHWMLYLSKRGFPVTKTQLLNNVTYLIKQLSRETPFANGKPGRHWYEAFLRRHSEISLRIAQNLPKSRACVTEDILRGWFKEIEQHLIDKQIIDINGDRIFNCDESAFFLCPKGERVLTRKGDNAVYNFTQNNDKECLTVLFMTNATGALVSPMIVFPYERIPYSVSQSVPIDWSIGKSENGWMTAETFYEYISNIFEPWLTAHNIERPVILYVDGHSSHMTLPVAQFCMDHQIELVALFPNATHLIQPLDVALFRTLKSSWRDCVNDWRVQNQRNLRREDFGPLLKIAIERIELSKVMSNGFKKCGLFPFSADALQYNQLLQKKKDDTIVTLRPEENIENHLSFFESNIDEDLLSTFKCANETGMYNGNIEDLGLFFFWQKILKLTKGHSSIVNTEGFNSMNHVEILVVNNANQSLDKTTGSNINENTTINKATNVNVNGDIESVFVSVNDNVNATENDQSVSVNAIEDNQPVLSVNDNVNATEDDQPVSVSTVVNDNDCLDVPPNIPDIFKKAMFWPRKNYSTTKKRVKVKIPSVATSLAWQEYYQAKEMEKFQHQIEVEERKRKRQETAEKKRQEAEEKKSQHQMAVEERKRKRQETVEKKKQEAEEKKKQKALQRAEKASKKNSNLRKQNKRKK